MPAIAFEIAEKVATVRLRICS